MAMMVRLTRRYRRLAAAGTLTAVAVGVALTGGPAPTAAVAVTGRAGPVLADQIRDDQWQLRELNAEAAWRTSTGRGVTVAVIDSGVDGTHPDLVGQVLPGTDLVRSGGDGQYDPVGHGTTVAGLIAGRRDDADGVEGLAPDARILPVRVLDEENRYDDALIVAQGVRWAVDHGATVINMSLGGTGDSPALAAALDYAFARDVVVVACTGNLSGSSPYDRVWYPAREPGIVSVAGLDRDTQTLWSGSITGRETVLTAPATGLIGARPGGFWQVQGTSFAAPLVAATAALLRSHWPSMSAADVVNRLIRTARDLGPKGRDAQFGFGLVDPVAALGAQVPAVAGNPLDDESFPGTAGFGPAPGDPGPGLDQPQPRRAGQAAPAAGSSGEDRWAAQPAGVSARRSIDPRWAVVALAVALLSAVGALLGLRLRRTGG
jgi:type VII secretion-associated serine protease mycosin